MASRVEYNFKTLVDNEHFCPYNKSTFDYLDQPETCKEIIDKIHALYQQINFQFSSPGNSFPRNIIYELNAPYRYSASSENSHIFPISKNRELEKEHVLYFNELRLMSEKFKFRKFEQAFINELNSKDQVILTSSFLTEDGMKKTILTSSNITRNLTKKIIYSSLDFN